MQSEQKNRRGTREKTKPRAPVLRKLAEPRRLEAYRFLSVLPAAVSEEARFPVGGNDAGLPENGSLRPLDNGSRPSIMVLTTRMFTTIQLLTFGD